MANHATKQGNEAQRPMGNSTVPVLFSLKNVQPLILGASPAAPSKSITPSGEISNSGIASNSTLGTVGVNPQVLKDPVVLSRPTKAKQGNSILRTIGTVLLILLVVLVIKMSVPSGSQETIVASQKSPLPQGNELAASEVSNTSIVVPPLPTLSVSTLSVSSEADSLKIGTSVASPSIEIGSAYSEADARQQDRTANADTSNALPALELSGSPVPTLLAAAPTAANPGTSPMTVPSAPQNVSPVPDWQNYRDTPSTELSIQSNKNAQPSTNPPYTATRPELHSADDIRETSAPNLDNMDELITLYRKGLGDGSATNTAPSPGASTTAKPVSTSSPVSPMQPFATNSGDTFTPTQGATAPKPYTPLSMATDWPTSSIAIPSSQVGGASRSESGSPSGFANNNVLPMAGQSYPPAQRTYEPLTVPAYEQPSGSSFSSQSSLNRYQAGMIRQPNGASQPPIAQPKLPYTPVGPSTTGPAATGTPTTGSSGSSFGYPPINVPTN